MYTGDIWPKIQLVLEKNKKLAQNWAPKWHGDDGLAVYGVTNDNETYYFNITQETCACRKWNLIGIPCSHAITCIWKNKKQPEEYVSNYYMFVSSICQLHDLCFKLLLNLCIPWVLFLYARRLPSRSLLTYNLPYQWATIVAFIWQSSSQPTSDEKGNWLSPKDTKQGQYHAYKSTCAS